MFFHVDAISGFVIVFQKTDCGILIVLEVFPWVVGFHLRHVFDGFSFCLVVFRQGRDGDAGFIGLTLFVKDCLFTERELFLFSVFTLRMDGEVNGDGTAPHLIVCSRKYFLFLGFILFSVLLNVSLVFLRLFVAFAFEGIVHGILRVEQTTHNLHGFGGDIH